MASEKTPLVSSTSSGSGGGQPPTAYFLDGVQKRSSVGDVSIDTTFSRAEGYEEVDNMPKGGVAEEFYPRPILERRGNTDFTGREADGNNNKKQHSMKMPSLGEEVYWTLLVEIHGNKLAEEHLVVDFLLPPHHQQKMRILIQER